MQTTRKSFLKWQWKTIVVLMAGYAMFYLLRKNFSLAMPGLTAEFGINNTTLGIFLTLHGVIYGLSRYVVGVITDRNSARMIMALGLALCAVVNILFGMSDLWASWLVSIAGTAGDAAAIATALAYIMGVLWMVNGFLQGMGVPPCTKMMTHWVHPDELATKMSVWNMSHSIGAGLAMALCSVSNMLNSMRKFSKEPYEMIRQKVAGGKVAGADETGVNVSGRNNWLWTFQNSVATYLAFDSSRSHGAITDNFTPKELEGKVWVTDRWPAYFMGDVGMEDHQICIAHLLRNLTYTMQAFPDDEWSLDMLDLLRDSVHHRNQGDTGLEVRTKMEKRLDELLARPPIYTKTDGSDTELDKLKKGIAKHRDYIFTFLTNPAVPPTNNDSEKALRPAKTKLKVSGCFRTQAGAQNYATVASVIQTAVKNGQNPFEVLRVIATLALA